MRNFLLAILWVLSLDAAAVSVSVNPDLPVGYNLDLYVGSPYWQSVSLPNAERPSGMGSPSGMMHLGTNTDVFGVGQGDYWLRYTLNPSSYEIDYGAVSAVSGNLWVSFTRQSNNDYLISVNPEKVTGYPSLVGDFNANWLGSGQVGVQSISGLNNPFNCTEGDCGTAALNLSFLQLDWNPSQSRYDLTTTAVGFDEVYSSYDWTGALQSKYNIAPVPLPTSMPLLLSSLMGLVGVNRYRRR